MIHPTVAELRRSGPLSNGPNRILEDQILRVIVEEHLRDELAQRNWWATTGKRLGWTDWTTGTAIEVGRASGMTPIQIEHRARLRLLVSMLKAARKAR